MKYDRLAPHLKKAVDMHLAKLAIDAQDARDRAAIEKRDERCSLEREAQGKAGMVNIPGPLLIRITRYCGPGERRYDTDNVSGGCKELRDAIAAALGRRGDSEEDELTFEYAQERGQGECMTEIQICKGPA